MARRTPALDDEKRSYGALWLLSALLLFVGALWAVADDNVFRRPWKKYQAGFNRLEISRLEEAIAAEQKRLDADPVYQAAEKKLAEAKASVGSGDNARRLREIEHELVQAREDDQSKDLNLRFVKSELEELRFKFDDALHHGHPTDAIQHDIDDREHLRVERQKTYDESQRHIETLQNEIKTLQGSVKSAEDELAKLATAREDLEQKLEGVSLGYFPGPKASPPFFGFEWQPKIPKIQQIVLDDFERNNFDVPVARVDRCMSCHAGINKAGFEDQPNPWKTHPKRDLLLAKHPPEKFGCTPCHNGQGPAINSPAQAHGNFVDEHGHLENVEFLDAPMLRGEKMQANCIKCHAGVQRLEAAEEIARGERLFEELGCHGCHLTEGYEELSKAGGVSIIGPSLRRIGAKLDHAWMVRWVKNPHEIRPRTRMPNFMFDDEQATQIVAFVLAASRDPSAEWRGAHPPPAVDAALATRGKEIVDSIGCRGCHALAPDEVAGQLGADKDIAPNLSIIGSKTDAQWIYHWVKNPRGYSAIARMPNLRLSDDEARAVTAYLVTLGQKQPGPADLDARLADPANVAAGEKLVRKYGCAGCHDIPGMESESRIGVELSTFGSKTREELFFGDRTDLPETWDDWTYHKLKAPRTYATKWIEQLMPQFDLAEDDIKALRGFLASRTDRKVPARWVFKGPGQDRIVAGRLLVARYNCTGCHVIENAGGDIRRLYTENPTLAPPILNGEGEKAQADWLFGFIKAPVPIRPWLSLRMPTFGLSDEETNAIVQYFGSLDRVQVPFVHLERAAFAHDNLEAGKLLMSKDYFDCFSCHQQGARKPQGPPEGWAPDLALAHARLNPDWIVKWLRDPQKVMPGTKMPSFFPGGPPDVLGGDDEAQIRALRDYIVALGLPDTAAPSPQQAAGVTTSGPGASQ
ncbi:MAG TPA: c-type cytochrome [Candidatus Binatia bacterium]|nr:c-type cytochrome [Candidatus Binatia bacterium]